VWFSRKARFFYPIPPAPRTAVLSTLYRSRGAIRTFEDPAAVRAFGPQAIAGKLPQIESLAGVVELTHAVIVFREESEPRLTDQERDRLWRAFHVPVFEQIVAADGTLYASECEAHDGLHIESRGFAVADNEIDRTPCACGRSTARLVLPAGSRTCTAAGGGSRSAAGGGS
jgi:hypothetical protein